jgi:hypothetical protein
MPDANGASPPLAQWPAATGPERALGRAAARPVLAAAHALRRVLVGTLPFVALAVVSDLTRAVRGLAAARRGHGRDRATHSPPRRRPTGGHHQA